MADLGNSTLTTRAEANPLRIVVGISGGIAAYKAVLVIRELVLRGHEVHAIPTPSALRFIGVPTLEAISRNPVYTDVFDDVAEVRHVALGQQADVIAVVPATANTVAKITAGIADNLLGTTLLASTAPLVIAPAMHTEMWEHPATQANIATLSERGAVIVGPATGRLTGHDTGVGRLEAVETIIAAIEQAGARAAVDSRRDWVGRKVLVSAGGTREPLDPVRFLGNRSSGRQGVAIAASAAARGAQVTLVAANLEVPAPANLEVIQVSTAAEMHAECTRLAPEHDIIVMTAAVADYRPVTVAEGKITKEETGDELTLHLTKNPDILRELAASKRPDQLVVGFAAETEPNDEKLLARGRAKLQRKGCDVLAVNRVGWNEGFQHDENEISLIARDGSLAVRHAGNKMSVAGAILDTLAEYLRDSAHTPTNDVAA